MRVHTHWRRGRDTNRRLTLFLVMSVLALGATLALGA